MASSIAEHFAELPDPRGAKGKRHALMVILTIAIMAVICGNDDFEGMEEFGLSKRPWLAGFLDLAHGIPTADTFRRVFARLDPEAFERCFMGWMRGLVGSLGGKLIAIDGKTLRRSFQNAWDPHSAVHMVSAFVQANSLVFAQMAVDDKSNEITAIPRLLELLDLHGATVSIDAMGCQRNIAGKIKEGGGEYVLALKGNQGILEAKVQTLFEEAVHQGFKGLIHEVHEETDAGHGRIEEANALDHAGGGALGRGKARLCGLKRSGDGGIGAGDSRGPQHEGAKVLSVLASRRDGGADGRIRARALVGGEQSALDAGCAIQRRSEPGEDRPLSREPLAGQTCGTQSPEAGKDLPERHRH